MWRDDAAEHIEHTDSLRTVHHMHDFNVVLEQVSQTDGLSKFTAQIADVRVGGLVQTVERAIGPEAKPVWG